MALVDAYNVAQAKTHLSEILERVAEGEEVLLTRRGKPVARLVPARLAMAPNILGAGIHDPNINAGVLSHDDWWKPLPDDETQAWYE
jgi:prevent-host-death family protein